MSVTVDQAFITQFESELKLAYQQMGSKLRNTVRLKTGVEGSTCRFQKMAKGSAQQKSRHGDVPVMNAVHSYVNATLEDWYAGDYVDKLDELKINIDERQATVNTGAYALGRKIDNLVIVAARSGLASAQKITTVSGGLTKAKVQAGFKLLNDKDVPDDGNRYCIVGPKQWNDLLDIEQFSSADYIGPGTLPWMAGTQAKKWLNMIFMMHTGLETDSTAATRYCLMYHRTAIGLAEGLGITTDITWQGTKAAHFVDNMLSSGAVAIDEEGIVQIDCADA